MTKRSYTTKTIKVLFGSSGNQCAHPDCTNPIIVPGQENSNDAVLGQICHIYAASDNGPRGKPGLTEQERNSPGNLILMCGFHHPLVDTQYQDYPAELLKQWKRDHEAKFQRDTAEAIRRQGQVQQVIFTADLTDQQIEAEVWQIRQGRHLVGYPTADKTRALVVNIENAKFAGGSSDIKAWALAWCARFLATEGTLARAKELLAKSRDLGSCPEAEIANAFIVAVESGASAALPLLASTGAPEFRSAMLRIVSNESGPEGALNWAQSAALALDAFDSDGKLCFIMNEEATGRWSDAYEHVQLLTPVEYDQTPVLNYAAAQAYLAHVVPEELRARVLFQVPFEASTAPLADDLQALQDRRRAIDLYDKLTVIAQKFQAVEVARLSAEMALWLRLRDPELHATALDVLRNNMRDDEQMLRYFPLAVQFGLKVDLNAVERRINERVALTGKGTVDEAVARLALAMTKETPAAVAEYIAAHRGQLSEFLERAPLLGIEIETLCRSGQVETAKALMAGITPKDVGEREFERLQRMIAEAEGADPAAERRKLYEKSGDLRDLVNLVRFLEQEQAWQDLCPLAETLFNRTRTAEDAFRVARALNSTSEYRRALQFLKQIPEIAGRDSELKSLLAWALYRDGQFSEASAVLALLRAERDHVNDRELFVSLAIASGQWDDLVGYTTSEWEHRSERTPEQLLRAGQLAQAVKAPHARDLIVVATEAAPEDAHVLASAYFLASSGGWESAPEVGNWLQRAAAKSDDEGPLKSFTMKELFELKPDWDRRQDHIYAALNSGQITVSGAAYALNQSLSQSYLLRAAANRQEPDARRRSLVHAFSGARPPPRQVNAKRIALDLTAIFTFAQLGLLRDVITHFERVLIPDQLLIWLFEERRRIVFHQPSQVGDAHFMKRLLADGSLKIFASQLPINLSLAQDIGFDLASMLDAALHSPVRAYVIRSSPVHRNGSVMEEEVDLTPYEPCLCSCQAVVEALRLRGMITASEEQRGLSYLKFRERRWPNEPRIHHGSILYLDDLSATYLRTAGVLGKLKGAGFAVYVTKSLDDQYNQLLAHEGFADEQLAIIENIRAVLGAALAGGRVEVIASPDQDGEDAQLKVQLNFLATDKLIDAFVVDDRFVNRYVHMTRGDHQTPILTSLDVIEQLVGSGSLSADDGREHRTTLRRSGYTFVPVLKDELTHYLRQAPIDSGSLVETAELRAIRESAQLLLLRKVLQAPHELEWLNQYIAALIQAVRTIWGMESVAADAEARCEWLLGQLDNRSWACALDEQSAKQFVVMSYAGVLHGLGFAPEAILKCNNESYHRWVDRRVFKEIKEMEPEIFDHVVTLAAGLLSKVLSDGWKENE